MENQPLNIESVPLPPDSPQSITRMKICESCENLNEIKFCKICGCFMPLKTKMWWKICPINKW